MERTKHIEAIFLYSNIVSVNSFLLAQPKSKTYVVKSSGG